MTEPSIATKFLIAGISNCCAGFVTNPLDVLKVRLQADGASASPKYSGMLHCAKKIFFEEGTVGFFRGVIPSLAREATYSTLRLGLYEPVRTHYHSIYKNIFNSNKERPTMIVSMLAGATAGCIGSAIASPTDLIKIRLQTAYATGSGDNSMIKTAISIYQNEGGISALWRGVGANIQRAALLTGCQVSFYDRIKNSIKDALSLLFDKKSNLVSCDVSENNNTTATPKKEPLLLFATSALSASFFTALITSPVDVARTRLMTSGSEFKGTIHCLSQTLKKEGLRGAYRGFLPNWFRLAPHSMVCFSVYETLRQYLGMKAL